MKLKLEDSFREFLSGRWAKIGGILLVGILLLLLGGLGGERAEPTADLESRAAEMCSLMDGVGECRVMITYHPDDPDRVYAVLVLCEGAESVSVRSRITSLFCSLYGIGAHRVEIDRLII